MILQIRKILERIMPLCNCCLSNLCAPKIYDKICIITHAAQLIGYTQKSSLRRATATCMQPDIKSTSNAKLPLHWPRLLNPWARRLSLLGRHCRLKRQSLSSRSRRRPKPLPEKSPKKTSLEEDRPGTKCEEGQATQSCLHTDRSRACKELVSISRAHLTQSLIAIMPQLKS